MGLRLQLRKQQAEAGDIILLYGDESEALTHPYLARAWAKSRADLRVPAPGQAKKVAMLGSLDHVTRQLIVHTSPTKRSGDFIAHLEQLDRLFGPQPGRQAKPVVLVEDNGPIRTSKRALAALAVRAHWLTVEWLPKYAPELNEIEPVFIFRYEPEAVARQLRPDSPLLEHGHLTPVVYQLNLADPNSLFVEQSFRMANRDLVYVSNSPSTEAQKVFKIVGGGVSTIGAAASVVTAEATLK